jgi:hypothetical protein
LSPIRQCPLSRFQTRCPPATTGLPQRVMSLYEQEHVFWTPRVLSSRTKTRATVPVQMKQDTVQLKLKPRGLLSLKPLLLHPTNDLLASAQDS